MGTDEGWRVEELTLELALHELRSGKAPYGAADVATIVRAVADVGARPPFVLMDGWVGDMRGLLHIHPTMIVLSREVPGSVRTDTYAKWPWRIELNGWLGRDSVRRSTESVHRQVCQQCFNPIDDRHADGCY